jgi:predicted Zn finger-like uncharacterized protein
MWTAFCRLHGILQVMVVACPYCSQRARLADDRVGARGVVVRCKKCLVTFPVNVQPDPSEEATKVAVYAEGIAQSRLEDVEDAPAAVSEFITDPAHDAIAPGIVPGQALDAPGEPEPNSAPGEHFELGAPQADLAPPLKESSPRQASPVARPPSAFASIVAVFIAALMTVLLGGGAILFFFLRSAFTALSTVFVVALLIVVLGGGAFLLLLKRLA